MGILDEIKGGAKKPVVRPLDVRVGDDGAVWVKWDDGHDTRFEPRPLRLACPCAACIDETTGRAILDPATVPQDVRAAEMRFVGNYGVQLVWSDGHSTGIYSWDLLRRIDPVVRAARPG